MARRTILALALAWLLAASGGAAAQGWNGPSRNPFDREARALFEKIQGELQALIEECGKKDLPAVVPMLQEHHDNLDFRSWGRRNAPPAAKKEKAPEGEIPETFTRTWEAYRKKTAASLIQLARKGAKEKAWGSAGKALVAAQFLSGFDEKVVAECRKVFEGFPVRVLSFNIEYFRFGGFNPADRWPAIRGMMTAMEPDVVGIQEGCQDLLNRLHEAFPDYGIIHVGNTGRYQEPTGKADYAGPRSKWWGNAIFFNTNRFLASRAGSADIKEGKAGGKGRNLLWADMIPQGSAKRIARPFTFFTTHLDPGREAGESRKRQVGVIFDTIIPERKYLEVQVFTGDYNEGGRGVVGDRLRAYGLDGPFLGIDWVCATRQVRVAEAATYRFGVNGHPPTDHSPCIAFLEWK
jgi:endonuclease/exonuclease/phosphatase family metal-dependent hydrolase